MGFSCQTSSGVEIGEENAIAEDEAEGGRRPRLPDSDSQNLRLYVFGPSGLKDYGSAKLHCKI